MINDLGEDFLNSIESNSIQSNNKGEQENVESQDKIDKLSLEQAQKNVLARKRIDELMEKKRLKKLLDDSDDW
ncbi:MAG: hypothetical protein OCD00_03975 [Colwellia sp.]